MLLLYDGLYNKNSNTQSLKENEHIVIFYPYNIVEEHKNN